MHKNSQPINKYSSVEEEKLTEFASSYRNTRKKCQIISNDSLPVTRTRFSRLFRRVKQEERKKRRRSQFHFNRSRFSIRLAIQNSSRREQSSSKAGRETTRSKFDLSRLFDTRETLFRDRIGSNRFLNAFPPGWRRTLPFFRRISDNIVSSSKNDEERFYFLLACTLAWNSVMLRAKSSEILYETIGWYFALFEEEWSCRYSQI